ncbi:thioredoxin family protein [Desulfovibrio sp. TomC]|uniref:thioredoxin family protein n=1 Tax=Desulfovibrio sp. TomC TaxID=1562888 RepID=UPI000575D16A|nr:thioredoxin family protein [Desulfovibrio sp. TomC]KHK01904.1 Thioredoxin [Desulfovibrio sp. TomC]
MSRRLAGLVCGFLLLAAAAFAADPAPVPVVPAPGKVTLVDLGAKACVPCKMMQPVLAAIEARYADRAAIIFIDVWEHRDEPQKFGLRVIPTQIFYDKTGKEVSRHEGFLDEKPIADTLDRLLAE